MHFKALDVEYCANMLLEPHLANECQKLCRNTNISLMKDKTVLYPIKMFLESFILLPNDSKKFHTPAKNHLPQYPVLKMTSP